MPTHWFCKLEGKEVGPISSQELLALAQQGRLSPKSLVRPATGTTWAAASNVKGLTFRAAAPTAGKSADLVDVELVDDLLPDLPAARRAPTASVLCRSCGAAVHPGVTLCPTCGEPAAGSTRAHTSNDPGQNAWMRMVMPVGRSGYAIAAGYLGLFSLLCFPGPIALIVGILAVRDIRRHPEKHGMGRAIFGIVMGGLVTLFLLWALFDLVFLHGQGISARCHTISSA